MCVQETGIDFYAIKADDSTGFNIMPLLEPTAQHIDEALKKGGKFLNNTVYSMPSL